MKCLFREMNTYLLNQLVAYLLAFFLELIISNLEMILSKELASELKVFVDLFNKDPTDQRFKECITFGPSGQYSVMFWCPLEMFEVKGVMCPLHNIPIKPSMLTSEFEKENSRRNPRLVSSITRNIVLIQSIYRCHDEHDLHSCSDDVLVSLPDYVNQRMDVKLYHRSAFHLDLIDIIFKLITKGNNFHQISEIIADMHLSDYIRHGGCEEDFYTGELTQYPSHDQVLFFIDL